MADKMMRLAGRDNRGLAKALKTNQEGKLLTEERNENKRYVGDFKEPHDEGYIGNITVSGLEVFTEIELGENVRDVRLGKTGIFVATKEAILKYSDEHKSELIWKYDFAPYGNDLDFIQLDYEDNVFILGRRDTNGRLIEKINGETGVRVWRNYNSGKANVPVLDTEVDSEGHLYVSGWVDANYQNRGGISKHNKDTGEIMWTFIKENPGQSIGWYFTIDSKNDIYLSHSVGIDKLSQAGANSTTPPTVVWSYENPHDQGSHYYLYVNVDKNGNVYRIEREYDWNGGNEIRKNKLLKLKQTTSGLEPLDNVLINEGRTAILKEDKIRIDEDGFVYLTSLGKLDSELNSYWGDKSPFGITDVRGRYLVGIKEVIGYNNDVRYKVFKTGTQLKENYLLGVK